MIITKKALTRRTFLRGAGITLAINNWTDRNDAFYAQTFTGAVTDLRGSTPMNQITFAGNSNSSTVWQSYDHQVTPAPEPATYGAIFMGGALGLLFWRRRKKSAAPATVA